MVDYLKIGIGRLHGGGIISSESSVGSLFHLGLLFLDLGLLGPQ